MSIFTGFTPGSIAFFEGLEEDNSKSYWSAHKKEWDSQVLIPMKMFLTSISEEFQPFEIFRPHRDIRFSKDKSPYKTQIGAVSTRPDCISYYFHLSASGLFAASGMYALSSEQLEKFRSAIAREDSGEELEQLILKTSTEEVCVGPGKEEPLVSSPRGYSKDHPRISLLRWKGIMVYEDFGAPSWLFTPHAVAKVEDLFRAATPINDWLTVNVGADNST